MKNKVVLEAYNLKKAFLRERPLYKQVLSPFGKGQKIKALDTVSFRLDEGQILGIVGPNRMGKIAVN